MLRMHIRYGKTVLGHRSHQSPIESWPLADAIGKNLEARAGVEPTYTDLQSGA